MSHPYGFDYVTQPLHPYQGPKAAIEALTVTQGAIAYATDTDELGTFDGAAWHWGAGGGGGAPAAHATTHEAGGSDPIPLDTLAAPSDSTTLDATTSKHGLAPKAHAPVLDGLMNVVGIENGETAYTNKAIFGTNPPATLSAASSSSAGMDSTAGRSDHSHAITTSHDPGAAASILATDAFGGVKLTGTLETKGVINVETSGGLSHALLVANTSDATLEAQNGVALKLLESGGKGITVANSTGAVTIDGPSLTVDTLHTKLDNLDTPDDNTDLNSTTGHHGLLPKLDGTTSNYLDGAGAFKAVDWSEITGKPISDLWFADVASGIAGYSKLNVTPTTGTENDDNVTITSGSGETLIEGYITDPLGITDINGGVWEFDLWRSVSATGGDSELRIRVYKRTAGGTETELFNVVTGDINDTTPTYQVLQTTQPDFAISATDRLVIKVFAFTTSGASRMIHFYHDGTTHNSNLHTTAINTSGVIAAHATTHEAGGSDPIALDTLAAPTDITTLNTSTSQHGLAPKLDGNAAHYLDGSGAWSTPAGGGGGFVGCAMHTVVAQSIPNSADTPLTYDTTEELLDPNGMHDGTNKSRINILSDGVYELHGQAEYDTVSSATYRFIYFAVTHSGVRTEIGDSVVGNANSYYGSAVFAVVSLLNGDFVEILAFQTTGGAVNITRSSVLVRKLG